ncbi:MAG: YcxB family protein [Myxococcales bacterium]|nr:YcxB family protein [Myxococcales bacterium]
MSAYRSDAHVKLSFALERDELLRAVRSQSRRVMLRMVVPVLVAVLGAVSALMLVRLPLVPGLLASAVVCSIVVAFVVKSLGGNRRLLERRALDLASIHLEATEEALDIRGGESGKRIAWSLVLGWRETDEGFLLFVDTSRFHLVPKRAFPGPESITAFRRLLEDRVVPGGLAKLEAERGRAWLPYTFAVTLIAVLIGTLVEALVAVVI